MTERIMLAIIHKCLKSIQRASKFVLFPDFKGFNLDVNSSLTDSKHAEHIAYLIADSDGS